MRKAWGAVVEKAAVEVRRCAHGGVKPCRTEKATEADASIAREGRGIRRIGVEIT